MSGLELCARLKERTGTGTKYFALTAEALPDARAHILQQGFDGLLMKPFMEKELIGLLNVIPEKQPDNDHALEQDIIKQLERMTYGDIALMEKILLSFVSETEHDLAALKLSMTQEEPLQAAEWLHKLSGRCGQVGARDFAGALRNTELALRNGKSLTSVRTTIDRQCQQTDELIREVAGYAEALRNVPTDC